MFANLDRALAAAGASFTDVIKLNYYVTDIAMLPVVRTIRDEYVDIGPPAYQHGGAGHRAGDAGSDDRDRSLGGLRRPTGTGSAGPAGTAVSQPVRTVSRAGVQPGCGRSRWPAASFYQDQRERGGDRDGEVARTGRRRPPPRPRRG